MSVRMKKLDCQTLMFEFLFENKSSKLKFHYNINGIMGTLHEDLRTFMTVSR